MHRILSSVKGLLRSTHQHRSNYFTKRSNRFAGKSLDTSAIFQLRERGFNRMGEKTCGEVGLSGVKTTVPYSSAQEMGSGKVVEEEVA